MPAHTLPAALQQAAGPRLQGKVAIVTGAGMSGDDGFGTGAATAILFARHGARVALLDRMPEHAERTLDHVRQAGGDGFVFAGDVRSESDCAEAVAETARRFGRLDILDNNVGMVVPGTVTEVVLDDWDRILETNVKAMVLASRFAIPEMAKHGGGSIINISSIAPHRPYKVSMRVGAPPMSVTPYAVSKGAVEVLTRAMAVDHGSQNIRVNCIAPGPLNTPRGAQRYTDAQLAMRRNAAPLGIEGNGWDVAWAAVFLASDEARYVSGIVLTVDGGIGAQGYVGQATPLR